MNNYTLISDFDIDISQILLIHQDTFVPGFFWTSYRFGRKFDGIVYCLSGCALFDYGNKKITLSAGQLVFIPACSAYTIKVTSTEPFTHYTVNFMTSGVTANEHTAFAEMLNLNTFHLTSPKNAELYNLRFDKLLSTWQAKRNGYQMMAKSIIYDILYLYFTDATVSYRRNNEYDKIRPAKHYLDKHFNDCKSIAELADMCGLSETHFRRLFVKILGVSPTEYRLSRQMIFAKDYLLSGSYSVSEVAALVGFDDANYFSRIFKQREGETPTEFLQN